MCLLNTCRITFYVQTLNSDDLNFEHNKKIKQLLEQPTKEQNPQIALRCCFSVCFYDWKENKFMKLDEIMHESLQK